MKVVIIAITISRAFFEYEFLHYARYYHDDNTLKMPFHTIKTVQQSIMRNVNHMLNDIILVQFKLYKNHNC